MPQQLWHLGCAVEWVLSAAVPVLEFVVDCGFECVGIFGGPYYSQNTGEASSGPSEFPGLPAKSLLAQV